MKIKITQKDIDNSEGCEGVWNQCPIARALKRKGFENPRVNTKVIIFEKNNKQISFKTPRNANIFIDYFDSSKEVKPFELILENPRLPTKEDLKQFLPFNQK